MYVSLCLVAVALVLVKARHTDRPDRDEMDPNGILSWRALESSRASSDDEPRVVDWTLLEHSVNSLEIDPDFDRDTFELIVSNGYPAEEHNVITPDGYILKMHRIPHGKNNVTRVNRNDRPVYLQHGLLGSSADFVLNNPTDCIAFNLADAGFDVWLGNIRGNFYSRRHIHLTPECDEFWDFSFDEHALIDLPSMVDYVLAATDQEELDYIGYSQGTMMMFIKSSLQDKTFNDKIRLYIALAPVTTLNNIRSPIRYLATLTPVIKELFKLFGLGEFLPSSTVMHFLAKYVCTKEPGIFLCDNVIFLFAGYDISNFNESRIPVYVNHAPAGTSVKNVIHYAMEYENKQFQFYDYGSEGNMKKYNSTTAPSIVLENCTIPTYVYHGEKDWLADPEDVAMALKRLPNVKDTKYIKGWNHLDFVWGESARKVIYNDIIAVLRQKH